MNRLLLILTLVFASMALGQPGKPVKNVTDADVTGAVHFSSDTVYVLNGFVFVDSLSTLTIEPGTVIKGKPGTGTGASALIVARGG
ncbi:MAG: T9SS type A sorting domain-containing protein, partial [Bacteroidota bacterium]